MFCSTHEFEAREEFSGFLGLLRGEVGLDGGLLRGLGGPATLAGDDLQRCVVLDDSLGPLQHSVDRLRLVRPKPAPLHCGTLRGVWIIIFSIPIASRHVGSGTACS